LGRGCMCERMRQTDRYRKNRGMKLERKGAEVLMSGKGDVLTPRTEMYSAPKKTTDSENCHRSAQGGKKESQKKGRKKGGWGQGNEGKDLPLSEETERKRERL